MKTVIQRFWFHVDKNGPIITQELGNCWVWIGCKHECYGQFRINNERIQAHRMSWILDGFELPDGALVCHKCDNPPCVRPSHLFLGTELINTLDKINKGRYYNGNHNGEHGSNKLTEIQVLEIRKLISGAVPAKNCIELGKIYGVTSNTIQKIKDRITWRYLL
ncbi:MAG: HNH endonuclease signature motif containing protein [Candidatus Omnitrophota bacterium]|jgi:hypothetical protein